MKKAGFTLIEVLVVVAIFAIAVVSYLTFFTDALVHTRRADERRIGVQKAMTMMEEVRAFVESGAENRVDLLDNFDDGLRYNPVLTIAKGVSDPADPLSGNEKFGAGWKYYRRIRVESLKGEESKELRQVSISVFQSPDGNPGGVSRAELSGIFRTLASPLPPTQVMDVYAIAIENIPGWWVNMTTLRPLVESAFGDLESANPGLKFRVHWITRLSYGRDRLYAPLVNSEALATESLDQVYFYPGRINRQGFWYYSPELMRGRIQIDGKENNVDRRLDDPDLMSYALADQFNSAMRYPDEKRIYEKRHQAGLDAEPSLRLLLDEMTEHPEVYRNALVINLHGELLPLPPVRHYSDAARDPEHHPNVRVVTHPERLAVGLHEAVKLRVYPYAIGPDKFPTTSYLKDGVSILLRDVTNLGVLKIQMIDGGGSSAYQVKELDPNSVGEITGDGVVLYLPNVPLRHPARGGQGLAPNARLYGLEYIPAPVGDTFAKNLASNGAGPKNTARYIITIPGSALPAQGLLTVQTKIGRSGFLNSFFADKTSLPSTTYVWLGQTPPPSERYQYMGDPRHCPYLDVKEQKGYNWYFKKIPADSDYDGYDVTENGWSKEAVDLDVPRYFQMFRDALMRSTTVFTTMTGFSFYYVGVGGEIGSDRPNGFPDGLPIAGKVYRKRGVEMVKAMTEGIENIRSENGGWYAIPWIGELYPDSHTRTWQAKGNLPAGEFFRAPWSAMPDSGKTFDRRRRTDILGSASFFNAHGEKLGPFNHIFSSKNNANATGEGLGLEKTFNFPIQEEIKAIRPFTLDYGGNFPPEWNLYAPSRNASQVLETYYRASDPGTARSSALLQLTAPAKGSAASYFVINGLSPAGETGTAYIGRYSVLTLLQGFLSAGTAVNPLFRIPQLPLIEITAPKEAAEFVSEESAHIMWKMSWRRWDFQPYHADTAQDFGERNQIFYVLKYSPDEGKTWFLARDNSPTRPGEYPRAEQREMTSEFDWNISDKKGNYIVRVEAFRQDIPLHYAFHQIGMSVKR